MRNLPAVSIIEDDSKQDVEQIDLKHWQTKANSEDLHALYIGEVTNNTHYKFHDLMFNVHYKDKSARFFRHEIITHFRELVEGTTTVEHIRGKAKGLIIVNDIVEKARKAALSD